MGTVPQQGLAAVFIHAKTRNGTVILRKEIDWSQGDISALCILDRIFHPLWSQKNLNTESSGPDRVRQIALGPDETERSEVELRAIATEFGWEIIT
jgi:hypothetical protein